MRSFRLADRRGLLQGTELSHIQSLALEMMLALDDRRDLDAVVTGIKLALVSNAPQSLSSLFPDIAGADYEAEQEGESVVDHTAAIENDSEQPGSWEFAPMSPEERDLLRGRVAGTISIDDLDEGWE